MPGFNDGMAWDPPSVISELQTPLRAAQDAWAAGDSYSWTVEALSTGEFLGRTSIRRVSNLDEWSIGFWTHPSHQRNGYAVEAAQATINFGFRRLGAHRITAAHATWNEASGKVLKKIGMCFVRTIAHGFKKHGVWVEEHEYEINLSP